MTCKQTVVTNFYVLSKTHTISFKSLIKSNMDSKKRRNRRLGGRTDHILSNSCFHMFKKPAKFCGHKYRLESRLGIVTCTQLWTVWKVLTQDHLPCSQRTLDSYGPPPPNGGRAGVAHWNKRLTNQTISFHWAVTGWSDQMYIYCKFMQLYTSITITSIATQTRN